MKKIISVVLLVLSLLSGQEVAANDFDVPAKYAIAVEASTGKILYEKNADKVAGIASITKILTAYMVYKEVNAGRLKWDDPVNISDYPYQLTVESLASNVPLEKRQYTVRQLLEASMIASANSAAIALAEKIAGSEPRFVDMMTKQLKEWGITDAKLVNASGLNNNLLGNNIYPDSGRNDENMMSAKDVAIIARQLIQDYPDVLTITSKTVADFDGTPMNTYNYMLENQTYYREGVDGLKTGTTDFAGASFVGTSTENGMRIISVILDADKAEDNPFARFIATTNLLDYVRNNYEMTTVIEAGQPFRKSSAPVLDGKQKTVSAVAQKDFNVVQKKSNKISNDITIKTNDQLTAPVKQDELVGTAQFNDKDLVGSGYLGDLPQVELLAGTQVKRSFFLKVWWNHFVIYVNENL
ncbi:D-alanyl-D-alanine carboxypeptidase PBP3 [Streptococcus cuniculipharyngis]|uniref:serine-type D-Ala-D-Ala carboxypeptidase n=1 Tax=Streptococcus cuniculipharyngis TaxID=1562651 RepID=A0A5C5SA79_9STRE|nr:D-alanyl-D-alanine carboxypeptidase PBP3 [Streptococcus cuniculipharyngis]TWS97428.1 D-alanyl-D-alanine carboxypeptidase [Streptococcus cuniculipharyngis]